MLQKEISQLMEKMKGKQLLDIQLYQIICLVLQSEMVLLCDQNQSDDYQISQLFDDRMPASHQKPPSDDQLAKEETDDKVDDTIELTLSDNETEDIVSQSKI